MSKNLAIEKSYGVVSADERRAVSWLEFVQGLVAGTLPLAVISAPLSERMCSGTPLASITSAIVSMTPKLLIRRATRMARHSPSIRVIRRSLRPSRV